MRLAIIVLSIIASLSFAQQQSLELKLKPTLYATYCAPQITNLSKFDFSLDFKAYTYVYPYPNVGIVFNPEVFYSTIDNDFFYRLSVGFILYTYKFDTYGVGSPEYNVLYRNCELDVRLKLWENYAN